MAENRSGNSYHRGAGKQVFYWVCGAILIFLNLPMLIIFPISFSSARFLTFPPPGFSFQWYIKFFERSDWLLSAWYSFKIAIVVAVISTLLGTLASIAVVRGKFRGRSLISSFIISPMIIPYVIIALASYFFLVDIKLVGSQTGLILIHTVLALPIVFIIVSNTLKGFDVSLEKAAMILGANKIKTFFRVTLPLIRTGIISAAFFSFLISFDELIIVLFIGGIRVVTLPRKMWEGVRMETDPTISAVATMLIVFSVFMLMLIWLIQYLSERRQKTND